MSKKDNILVVATTRKENIERSVKRLGRFDIKIEMYFPDAKERKEIIEYWCQKNEISTSEDSFMIAKKCFGKSFLKIIHIMDGAKEDLINAERLLRKYLVEYCFDDEKLPCNTSKCMIYEMKPDEVNDGGDCMEYEKRI